MYGRVDEISLKRAKMISITWRIRSCAEVCIPLSSTGGLLEASRRFGQFCCDTILSFSQLSAQILDVMAGSQRKIWNSGALRSLQQLQVITKSLFAGDGIDYSLLYQALSLKHIRGQIYGDLADLRGCFHHEPGKAAVGKWYYTCPHYVIFESTTRMHTLLDVLPRRAHAVGRPSGKSAPLALHRKLEPQLRDAKRNLEGLPAS